MPRWISSKCPQEETELKPFDGYVSSFGPSIQRIVKVSTGNETCAAVRNDGPGTCRFINLSHDEIG